ncbi:(2Fe-2S)-binding protein [Thauera chlorobenzoica]|uniref:Bacterioferritin-associated ferredoxin n=1 Tax=Thauera chlorobenzoica TaxID=96773 RepID=A0A1H5WRG3_9RHOO|nr:(2Fe-2S)-binding protein [Thauera chlorobenzoica]APR04513.1 bacterioferritin-associated ferredoxin [Thauera chlorobenzoica]SEG02169.1 bacterioferritin-associated ferredoxin [Thauera chlorobenzoica]
MYVCVCNAVTERQIDQAVRAGATSLRHLRHQLGVSADCGRCARCAQDCLRVALCESPRPAPAAPPAHAGSSLSFALEAS